QLGTKEPFLHKLVPAVVDLMGGVFPELRRDPQRVRAVIQEEERSFLNTLDRGLALFQEAAQRARRRGNVLSGEDAFDLHTTYGVFIDITEQMASEAGLRVDRPRYEELLDDFRRRSGEGRKKLVITAVTGELPKTDDSP